jgi:hypothetical protein
MDKILELAAVDAAAAEAGHGATAQPAHTHADCLNCDARLHGRYCHACGQSSDDHHRSIVHLMWEAVEGFTHLDGRLAKTLPALLFRPGRLARDHIEGRRMRHVPPFRLFLITLLVFMFAAETVVKGAHTHTQSAETKKVLQSYQVGGQKVVVLHAADTTEIKDAVARGDIRSPFGRWLEAHIGRAASNREFYLMLVFEWAHRLAILMLPILAGLLTLLYAYKRQFYVYDHLVVSMQYLSFCFLLWAVMWVLPSPVQGWLMLPAIAWTPFNLYLILRTAYGSGRIGAGVKALFVWTATVVGFGALTVGLLVFALNQV